MGHIRLGRLPRTWKWQQVVALLAEAASVDRIAAASADAAEADRLEDREAVLAASVDDGTDGGEELAAPSGCGTLFRSKILPLLS